VTALVQQLRDLELYKVPGVSETLDWVAALAALDRDRLDPDVVEQTLGVVLKSKDDIEAVRSEGVTSPRRRRAPRAEPRRPLCSR